MLDKIFGWLFAVAGICTGLFFVGIGISLLFMFPSFVSWCAVIAICCFSALLMVVSVCPLLNSLKKSTALKKETPKEPEKDKIGFFAPIELI